MFSDEGFKCSKFERVKDKAGKRLSHIRFSPYRGRLATREDSRAHPLVSFRKERTVQMYIKTVILQHENKEI